jgi:hypothetical protein
MLKKILFAGCFLFLYAMANAQTSKNNCYKEWYQLFTERGAKPIPDGENDIIISIIKDDISNCYLGRLTVKAGKIVLGSLLVQTEDGGFEKLNKTLKKTVYYSSEQITAIENGMSHSFLTSENEVVRAYFYKSLNSPAKKLKEAPAPSTLNLK